MPDGTSSTARQQFEAAHAKWLAPYATGEAESGGRKFSECRHPYRTCYQRDRARIVHCSAFRRLDFKTQVFVPHEHDHFRTRLTHTLEVAQIARVLGRSLRLNEDLIEAIALAHDLGHPPFGHAGESVLDDLMAEHGHFEHNRQSLRVVDYLEHPYTQFRGLNLTRVVRECMAKHESPFDAPACEEFDSELYAPLEGQLVDLADEIAYTAADLDDALAAAWVSINELTDLSLWREAWRQASAKAPQARPIHKRIGACRAVLAAMADDCIAATAERIRSLGVDSPDAARQAPQRCAAFSPSVAVAVKQMQGFLLANVYEHPQCVEEDQVARRILQDLFTAYVSDPGLLPDRYRRRIPGDSRHRVACDYIAGMTDRFCKDHHAAVYGQ